VSRVVLDASALLVVLNQEPGVEKLTPEILREAVASTVNLSEVQAKLVREGVDPDEAWELALSPAATAEPFTGDQAKTAGSLIRQTRPLGLSLGDRACLALAMELKAPVYTADKEWKKLKLGVSIRALR
jgi:ribonuclease VapC